MDYLVLVKTYQELESVSAKLKKTEILARLFSQTPTEELNKVVLLAQGLVYPKYTGLELGIATQMMIKAISKATGIKPEVVEEKFKKTGDLGLAAEECVKLKKQVTLFTKKLTIDFVFKNLQELALVTGKGSQEKKLKIIAELLASAKPEEARYVVRTILQELRIGVAEGIIRDAIVDAFLFKKGMSKEEKEKLTEAVEYAWNIISDFGEVARIAKEKGVEGLRKVTVKLGRPIQVMLGEKAESIKEVLDEFKKIAAEYKYDGARVQCLPAGSFVLSNPEPKAIEKLNKDDLVLSSSGVFKRVTHTFKRFYKGELIFVKPAGLVGSFLTPEHPILVVRSIKCPYKRKNHYCRPYSKRMVAGKKYWIDYKPEWVEAKDLKIGDFVCFPLFKENKDIDYIDLLEFASDELINKQTTKISNEHLINNKKKVKRFVEVNEEFLELIGWYIAEGSSNPKWGNISIALGIKEEKEALRIKKLFENVFSLKASIRKRDNTIEVYCRNKFVASFLSIFGNRAYNKKIPDFLMLLPSNKIGVMIRSLIKGNGHIHKNKVVIKLSSLKLLMQLQLLLTKFDIFSSISKGEDEREMLIKGKRAKAKKTFQLIIKTNLENLKKLGIEVASKKSHQMWFKDKNGFWTPIRKINRVAFEGYVYNLETESNDFSVPFVVHNCHKQGDKIWLFTRREEEVTKQFPDLVKYLKESLKANECIVEGEALAVNPKTGLPLPFQVLSQRIHRKYDIEKMVKEIPVQIHLFDIVYLEGKQLFDKPFKERRKILEKIVKVIPGKVELAKQLVSEDLKELESFYQEALNAKQEGLMLKVLDSPYVFGRHVGTMYKIKPIMETLDLVIVGATYGEGLRAKWLSSYVLACRDPDTGEFLPCGMMGTGLTEEQFQLMTDALKDLIVEEKGREVKIRPKIVVEVAFQEIQKSPNYKSGYALRFPRLVRIREDKGPEEADTIERVEELFKSQGLRG